MTRPTADRDVAAAQRLDERGRGRLRDRLLALGPGVVEQRPVFRHHGVEEIDLDEHRAQIVELPSGDEQEFSSRCAHSFQGGDRARLDAAVMSQGAVVVAGKCKEAHVLPAAGAAIDQMSKPRAGPAGRARW